MPEMSWFACYPEKWLGALAEMKPDVQLVYLIVCFRIYEKRKPIPDTNEALGRRTGYRPTHVARIIEKLITLGKLRRTEDGCLTNPFCEKEIAEGAEIALTSAKKLSRAGKKSSEKRQQNQRSDPTHLPLPSIVEDREPRPKRTRTRSAFPVGWIPEQEQISYARHRGFDTVRMALMWEAFGNHHTSRGNLMADWAAAWRTWVNNEIKFSANRKGNGHGKDDSRSLVAAGRRLSEKLEQSRRVGGMGGTQERNGGARDAASDIDVRLLPER